jgi:hypothetical protein
MQAIPGGKAQHDTSDAHQIAVLRRGGMLPHASVSPAARRATRALRRRRRSLTRNRAALLTQVQPTHGQDHLPDLGKKIASKANRVGVAERFPAPAVPKSLAVALALITAADQRRRDLEWALLHTAQQPAAHPLSVLQTVPGIGPSLRLVRL